MRSSWFKVTETELLIGVFRPTSALPQYLMQAMFVGAVCVVEITGYAILVNRRTSPMKWCVQYEICKTLLPSLHGGRKWVTPRERARRGTPVQMQQPNAIRMACYISRVHGYSRGLYRPGAYFFSACKASSSPGGGTPQFMLAGTARSIWAGLGRFKPAMMVLNSSIVQPIPSLGLSALSSATVVHMCPL